MQEGSSIRSQYPQGWPAPPCPQHFSHEGVPLADSVRESWASTAMCSHPAGEGREGQQTGAGREEEEVHGRQALPSSHPLGFPFHVHSYWTPPSHTPASAHRIPCRAVLMFRTQRGGEWDLPCPMVSSLPRLASDCDVPSRAHPKVSLTLTPGQTPMPS